MSNIFPNTSANVATTYFIYTQTVGSNTPIYPVWYTDSIPTTEIARALAAGRRYDLPDGAVLDIDNLGNYQLSNQNNKVIYRANRVREFNPYISASDLLEAFIGEVGRYDGVVQDEILKLPIEAFINWLILKAAERDGDSTAGLPTVEQVLPAPKPRLALPNPHRALPRCAACGRFIRKAWAAAHIAFCSPEHMQLKLARIAT